MEKESTSAVRRQKVGEVCNLAAAWAKAAESDFHPTLRSPARLQTSPALIPAVLHLGDLVNLRGVTEIADKT